MNIFPFLLYELCAAAPQVALYHVVTVLLCYVPSGSDVGRGLPVSRAVSSVI